jgi:hypothetical protein
MCLLLTGNRSSFRTDTAISNSRAASERVLKPWVPDSNDGFDGSLEKSGSSGTWDQFAENERLFGVKTDYDENIYTTTIDRGASDYQQRLAAADKTAREIQQSTPTTAHVAEERIMDFVGGDDQRDEEDKYAHKPFPLPFPFIALPSFTSHEEFLSNSLPPFRYSGVRRQQDFPPLSNRENKYTPPARRAPTGQATVKGAPVDPAIISSQLKSTSTSQKPSPKPEESKSSPVAAAPSKAPVTPTSETKAAESKSEAKANPKQAEPKAAEPKTSDAKNSDKAAIPLRPSGGASRTVSPQAKDSSGTSPAAPSATSTVTHDVLKEFKTFANQQRLNAEKVRSSKAKADKEVKLIELKKFADTFKLSTPVPSDLISIIAKDPAKQKQIQAKALQNAEDVAKQKADVQTGKDAPTSSSSSKETPAKTAGDASAAPAATTPAENRSNANNARPGAPQHSSSPSSLPGRHPGARQPYGPQPHYQPNNYRGSRGPPHVNQQYQTTGNLAQRLREQQKMHQPQHPHNMGQHVPADNMRLPPTGPAANNADSQYQRRLSGVPPPHMGQQAKLNPNSHEFRPNAFAPAFNPAGPSQGSSPRSTAANNAVETPASSASPVVVGKLIRRKTNKVDASKCDILVFIKTIQPPAGRNYDDNEGLRPSYDTQPTWRHHLEAAEKPDSTMQLTYNEYFDKLPLSSTVMATPNPPHVLPSVPHQHQLPFHLQQGGHNQGMRQSPHAPPMQMQAGQHGHMPHVPYTSNPDDHRMMHSSSAQSYASPRMTQVPMAYPPTMNSPAQMPYNQPVMQPYMTPGAPQMTQFRSFSNNPQFMPQQPPHMAAPIMVQPQFIASPSGPMVAAAPQVQMYPGAHPQFMPPGAGPPQPMTASNGGFPSPGRPAAPMMVHQGSHQGQPMYGMSPGMQYQQPVYAPQQPQNKFSGQRPPQ